MPQSATVKFYIGSRWMRGAQNVKIDPSGGETQAIPGGTDEPVGYMTTPRGLSSISFEFTPKLNDSEWTYLKQLEREKTPVACIYQLGVERELYRDGVVQPLPRDTQDGGMAAKVSVKIVAMPMLPA